MGRFTRANYEEEPWRTHGRRVLEPCDDDDIDDDEKQSHVNHSGMTKTFLRRRHLALLANSAQPICTFEPSPTPLASNTSNITSVDSRRECSSTKMLVQSIKTLTRSMAALRDQEAKASTHTKPVPEANSKSRRKPLQQNPSIPLRTSHCRRRKDAKLLSNHTANKSQSTFLKLPSEIRNLVYELLIPKSRILVVSTQPNKELQALKLLWNTEDSKSKRPRLQLYHILDKKQIGEGFSITQNLLLVCSQVRSEAELLLYSRTTFCFDSFKNLRRFLDRASKLGIGVIEQIELYDQGYGNTKWTKDEVFQQRYYQRWQRSCAYAGERLTNLKHLKLEAHLQAWPCNLCSEVPDAAWKASVLQLTPQKIDKVELKLRHRMLHRHPWLTDEWQHKLENRMMTEFGQRRRNEKEAQEVLDQLAATKVSRQVPITPGAFKKAIILTITQQELDASKLGVKTASCDQG